MRPQSALNPEFDSYADEYEAALQKGLVLSGEGKEYFASARMKWLERRLGEIGFSPNSALDFGCGTGTSVPLLLGLPGVESVIGVDVSERSLEVARRRHGSERARFSLISECPPKGACDLAFTNGVFHHIPLAERAEAVSYVFRTLRAGGVFAFWENNPWNPGTRMIMKRIPFDQNAITLSPPEGRRLLRNAGFQIMRSDFLFFFPRALAWFRPVEPALISIPFGAQYLILARKES